MPNRILREGILTSSRISKLGWAEEVFYRRLMSVVDDFGRYFADVGLLRAACYPRQLNKVSDSDVEKWLRACVAAALVRVYSAEDEESYLELLDFKQQVRAKASKYPEPRSTCVADATQTQANAHLGVFVDVSVSGGEVVGGERPAAPSQGDAKGSRIPDGWAPSESLMAWALDAQPTWNERHLALVTEKFGDYWKAQPGSKGRKTDWDATFRNWVRNEKAMGGQQSSRPTLADHNRAVMAQALERAGHLGGSHD